MGLRNIPKVVQSLANATVSYTSSPAGDHRSSTDINGSIIDREVLGRNYTWASPFLLGSGQASTAVDAKITLAAKLQHGTSSDGGDMTDYSTQNQAADAVFFTTAMTTSYTNWTTGAGRFQTLPGVYDLRGAGRFIRPVFTPTINFNATSTTPAAELLSVSGGVVFMNADEEPPRPNTDVYSTSTST